MLKWKILILVKMILWSSVWSIFSVQSKHKLMLITFSSNTVEKYCIPDTFLFSQILRLFAKNCILDVWQGSEYGSEHFSTIYTNLNVIGNVLIFHHVNSHFIGFQKLPHYIWNSFVSLYPINIPRVFRVKTTWKWFPCPFNVEYTWCICRVCAATNCEHVWNINGVIWKITKVINSLK